MAKVKKGNLEEAIKDFTSAIGIDPKFGHAYYNRGVANKKLGNSQKASQDFSSAQSLLSEFMSGSQNAKKTTTTNRSKHVRHYKKFSLEYKDQAFKKDDEEFNKNPFNKQAASFNKEDAEFNKNPFNALENSYKAEDAAF